MTRAQIVCYICTALLVLSLPTKVYAAESAWIQVLPDTGTNSIVATPYGLIAGNKNPQAQPDKTSLYISKDTGTTWEKLTLKNKEILSLYYDSTVIYAGTDYNNDNDVGLYISSDIGKTWYHSKTPYKFSIPVVAANKNVVFIGSHVNGLWVSRNGGATWSQTIGDGYRFGPYINDIQIKDNLILVSTLDEGLYRSINNGVTWERNDFFARKATNKIVITPQTIYMSVKHEGIYKSVDNGETWQKEALFTPGDGKALTFFNNKIYVMKHIELDLPTYTVVTSEDGINWSDTHLNLQSNAEDTMSIVGLNNSFLFTGIMGKGIYRYQIPQVDSDDFRFMALPWRADADSELMESITAFFDHSYPLLGYAYKSEPVNHKYTTTNFLGLTKSQPEMFYSSHNGIDFDRPLGSDVLAVARGKAYYDWCSECGHTIKINHLNGYQSTYMHLNDNGLITTNRTVPINVEQGAVIGKVGITGNTTGPHIHISVTKDVNANGIFTDDYPHGLVDPFGWQVPNKADPWELFSWQDTLGNHIGSISKYLWQWKNDESSSEISEPTIVKKDNKSVTISPRTFVTPFTLIVSAYARPYITKLQKHLDYIPTTSVVINAYDAMKNSLTTLNEDAEIEIQLTKEIARNVLPYSLKIYFLNELTDMWEPLETFFDEESKTLKAKTNHFSQFVVLGEKNDFIAPETSMSISGEMYNGWYTEFPLIELTTIDDKENYPQIYFTFNGETSWQNYNQAFRPNRNGLYAIEYYATDGFNIEETKTELIRVNSELKEVGTVKIKGTIFDTN